jgi:hypothetical protein
MTLKADRQARDLEAGAREMAALADQLRNSPVTLAELAAELGQPVDDLARKVNGDVYRDDRGFRVVTRQLARTLIGERDAVDEQRQAIRERSEAAARELGERLERERAAMLAAVDRHHQRYGATTEVGAGAALAQAGRLDDLEAKQAAYEAEEAAKVRGTRRYNSDGQLVDSHGNVIG